MKSKRRRSSYVQAKATERAVREDAAAYGVECTVVSVRDAKDQLSGLLEKASLGDQIVITSDGRPKAMIVRYRPMIKGSKWTSRRTLRNRTPVSEDSVQILREMRDAGY
jgi:prevent-host-death family protein